MENSSDKNVKSLRIAVKFSGYLLAFYQPKKLTLSQVMSKEVSIISSITLTSLSDLLSDILCKKLL